MPETAISSCTPLRMTANTDNDENLLKKLQ